jgi:hypothetical protein
MPSPTGGLLPCASAALLLPLSTAAIPESELDIVGATADDDCCGSGVAFVSGEVGLARFSDGASAARLALDTLSAGRFRDAEAVADADPCLGAADEGAPAEWDTALLRRACGAAAGRPNSACASLGGCGAGFGSLRGASLGGGVGARGAAYVELPLASPMPGSAAGSPNDTRFFAGPAKVLLLMSSGERDALGRRSTERGLSRGAGSDMKGVKRSGRGKGCAVAR